jgi:AraC family L-rhamnose operon regulatory protein RhaS
MIHLKPNEFFLNSKSSITTELRSPQEPFPEHYHSFEEIIIVSKGSGIHVVNDIPMCLSKNYVCFVAQRDRHLFENVSDLFLSNVLFIRDKFQSCPQLSQFLPSTETGSVEWFIEDETAQRVNYIIERLNFESHCNNVSSEAMSELLFQQLIVELWRGKIVDTGRLSPDDRVIAALVHINKNHASALNIESLACYANLSVRMLTKEIKRATGMSFNQYLHFIRAKQAMYFLINTDHNITDIAFDVGYTDSNYFSTKFKQVLNKKPSDVRINFRKLF